MMALPRPGFSRHRAAAGPTSNAFSSRPASRQRRVTILYVCLVGFILAGPHTCTTRAHFNNQELPCIRVI